MVRQASSDSVAKGTVPGAECEHDAYIYIYIFIAAKNGICLRFIRASTKHVKNTCMPKPCCDSPSCSTMNCKVYAEFVHMAMEHVKVERLKDIGAWPSLHITWLKPEI